MTCTYEPHLITKCRFRFSAILLLSSVFITVGNDEGKKRRASQSMPGYKPGVTRRLSGFFWSWIGLQTADLMEIEGTPISKGKRIFPGS